MFLKHLLVNLQRMMLIGTEAIIVVLLVQMFWSLMEFDPLAIVQIGFIFGMMLFTVIPLFMLNDRKSSHIWIGAITILWLVMGLVLHFPLAFIWIPIVLCIWRSISSVIIEDYLPSTIYKRVVFSAIILALYISVGYFAGSELWQWTALVSWLLFAFILSTMMSGWLLDELKGNEETLSWKSMFRTQGLLLVFIGSGIAVFIVVMEWFKVIPFILSKIIYFVMYPIMKLFELILPLLQFIIGKSYQETIDNMTKGRKKINEQLPVDEIGNPMYPILMTIIKWGSIALFVVMLLVIIFIVIKRYMRNKIDGEDESGLVESRRILDDMEKNRLKPTILERINKWFGGQEKDPVRLFYRKFIKQYKLLRKEDNVPTLTAQEMMNNASTLNMHNREELETLTTIYEQRRYGRVEMNKSNIEKMKHAVQSWYNPKSVKGDRN